MRYAGGLGPSGGGRNARMRTAAAPWISRSSTGAVTGAFVTTAPGADAQEVAAAIEREMPQLATVRNADEIIVLEGGEIVERGTHDELIARRGAYDRLWRVQTGDAAAAAQ